MYTCKYRVTTMMYFQFMTHDNIPHIYRNQEMSDKLRNRS